MTGVRNDPHAGSLLLVIVLAVATALIIGETTESSLGTAPALICAAIALIVALSVGLWVRHKWLDRHSQ